MFRKPLWRNLYLNTKTWSFYEHTERLLKITVQNGILNIPIKIDAGINFR